MDYLIIVLIIFKNQNRFNERLASDSISARCHLVLSSPRTPSQVTMRSMVRCIMSIVHRMHQIIALGSIEIFRDDEQPLTKPMPLELC